MDKVDSKQQGFSGNGSTTEPKDDSMRSPLTMKQHSTTPALSHDDAWRTATGRQVSFQRAIDLAPDAACCTLACAIETGLFAFYGVDAVELVDSVNVLHDLELGFNVLEDLEPNSYGALCVRAFDGTPISNDDGRVRRYAIAISTLRSAPYIACVRIHDNEAFSKRTVRFDMVYVAPLGSDTVPFDLSAFAALISDGANVDHLRTLASRLLRAELDGYYTSSQYDADLAEFMTGTIGK